MTKKEATELARKGLRYGYFVTNYRDARVKCPRCGEHDVVMYHPTDGSRFTQSEKVRQLAQGVLDCALNAEYEGAEK